MKYPKIVQKEQPKVGMEGEWELIVSIFTIEHQLIIDINYNGIIKLKSSECKSVSEDDLQLEFISDTTDNNFYIFTLVEQRQCLVLSKDQAEFSYRSDEDKPDDFYVIKFSKVDLANPEGVDMLALVRVWEIKDYLLKPVRIYYLRDPVIKDKLHEHSPLDKIIHTTLDGEAYFLYKDKK